MPLRERNPIHWKMPVAIILVAAILILNFEKVTAEARESGGFLTDIVSLIIVPMPRQEEKEEVEEIDEAEEGDQEDLFASVSGSGEDQEQPTSVLSDTSTVSGEGQPEVAQEEQQHEEETVIPPPPPPPPPPAPPPVPTVPDPREEEVDLRPPPRRSLWDRKPSRKITQYLHPIRKKDSEQSSSSAPSQSSSAVPKTIIKEVIRTVPVIQERIIHVRDTINNIDNTVTNIEDFNVSETIINAVTNTYATNNVNVEIGNGVINADVNVNPIADALNTQEITGTSETNINKPSVDVSNLGDGDVFVDAFNEDEGDIVTQPQDSAEGESTEEVEENTDMVVEESESGSETNDQESSSSSSEASSESSNSSEGVQEEVQQEEEGTEEEKTVEENG